MSYTMSVEKQIFQCKCPTYFNTNAELFMSEDKNLSDVVANTTVITHCIVFFIDKRCYLLNC